MIKDMKSASDFSSWLSWPARVADKSVLCDMHDIVVGHAWLRLSTCTFDYLSIFACHRLLECYKRMAEPCLDIVDASGSPDEVLQSVLGKVRQQLPKLMWTPKAQKLPLSIFSAMAKVQHTRLVDNSTVSTWHIESWILITVQPRYSGLLCPQADHWHTG